MLLGVWRCSGTEHCGELWEWEWADDLPSLGLDGSPLLLSASLQDSRTCVMTEDPMRFQCWGDGSDGGLGRGNTSSVGNSSGEVFGSTVGIQY